MLAYLDNNSTTPVHREVLESMLPFFREQWGNASSAHRMGRRAREAVEQARGDVAALVGAAPSEIIFTGSGTEADNLALIGACLAARAAGRGDHVIVSAIEHHAVLKCVPHLEALGFRATLVGVGRSGRVDPGSVLAAATPRTLLVSLMHANNETGMIQPVESIGPPLRGRGILVHTDAVQTAARIRLRVDDLGVDLLTISAHKLHGPKGVGALYVRKGTALHGMFFGGGQEEGVRPGTYNVPGIVGFGTAARLAGRSLEEDSGYVAALTAKLEAGLHDLAPRAVVLGEPAHRLPNTLCVCFPGENNRVLVASLDGLGVAVSTGAACSAGAAEPSHVLQAMGVEEPLSRGAVRFSLGSSNAFEDVEFALAALKKVLAGRCA